MNPRTPQNFDALVSQAQIAHRLIIGFYQRLLPTIQRVAHDLELTFWAWRPTITNLPCRKSQQPADHWAWDMAPLMATNHHYWRTSEGSAKAGDVILGIWVSFDSHYSDRKWMQWGLANDVEPDATQLPIGPAVVKFLVCRCDQPNGESLKELWGRSGEIKAEDSDIGRWQAISPELNAIYLKKSLADFIASPEDTIAQLRSLLGEPAP